MNTEKNLHENFLTDLTKESVRVFVFLTNGIKLTGQLMSHDENTILLKDGTREQIIFRHAVATIMPEHDD